MKGLAVDAENSGRGALHDLTVVDLSSMLAAPLSAMLLADLGARVIKVEPVEGDTGRRNGWLVNGESLWWRLIGRNKEAISLDLKSPEGRAAAEAIIDRADVLIENMRPGKLEALGLAPEELWTRNPGLVVLRITGYGQSGPAATRAAFGTQAEALSGFAYGNGHPDGPPTLPSFPIADTSTGLYGAFAVLAALRARDSDPERRGQVIDLSLVDAFFSLLGPQASVYQHFGQVAERLGNRSPFAIPRDIYATSDGRWVAISCSVNEIALRALRVVERPDLVDDPRFATLEARREHIDELDEIIRSWMARHTADEAVAAFSAAGAAASHIYSVADLADDEHFSQRGIIESVPTHDIGELDMQAVAPRLSRTPGRIRWSGRPLGHDTAAILEEHGYSDEEIERLRTIGVIR